MQAESQNQILVNEHAIFLSQIRLLQFICTKYLLYFLFYLAQAQLCANAAVLVPLSKLGRALSYIT